MEVKSHASLEVGAEVRAGDDDAKKGWWPTRNADVDPHDTNRIAIHRIPLAGRRHTEEVNISHNFSFTLPIAFKI